GTRQRGSAQPHPAARSGDRALPSGRNTGRMGHRHSSEECRGASVICGAEGGVAPVAARSVAAHLEPRATSQRELKPALRPPAHLRAALLALRVYQAYLSHLFAGSCRFQPTCSRYAYEAIQRFGLARGAWLAVKRLLRCHPISRSFGFDPVPERFATHERGPVSTATEEIGRASCRIECGSRGS